jgi:hypothetical protein
MTQKTLQILAAISGMQAQLTALQNPSNQINQLNNNVALLQAQLTPDIEPDPDSLAFAIAQAGNLVTVVQAAAAATNTTLAPIALKQTAQQSAKLS